jgi:hypothetical protein
MKSIFGRFTAGAVLILAGLVSGCATQVDHFVAGQALAETDSSTTLVFGKFRLIRNGEEARIGDGVLDTSAQLNLESIDGKSGIVGTVGDNGEFGWALQPGYYRVASISFNNRGERVEPLTDFTFEVTPGSQALYIGTVTMEASFDSGYYGINGTVDSYTVSNDCATDCASRLDKFGLSDASLDIGLMQQQRPVASTR